MLRQRAKRGLRASGWLPQPAASATRPATDGGSASSRSASTPRSRSATQGLGSEAADAAEAEGAALDWREAASYAARARGERKRPSHGWAALTPTEQQVVALVAEGLTNPQIAERLLMGRATVKTHLDHVFAKTGLHTRTELAAEYVRGRQTSR